MTYALALDNPPLLVVCDRLRIEIHTHFTGTPSEVYRIRLEEIGQPEPLARLRALFENPEQFRSRRTDHEVTQEAAGCFAAIAAALAQRGHDPRPVAHFLIQCLFCMFAEDVGLLPAQLFERIVEKSAGQPEKLVARDWRNCSPPCGRAAIFCWRTSPGLKAVCLRSCLKTKFLIL